jgi:predicted DNA-binding transcriptional regulator YafY
MRHWGWWCVVGCCHLHQSHRSFRVYGVVGLTLPDETFNVPDDFDVQAYAAVRTLSCASHAVELEPDVLSRSVRPPGDGLG